MNFKVLILTLLVSSTSAINLQAKSTTSILQALADGDDKGKDDGNSTEAANVTLTECAAEGEFCECDGDIIYGALGKDHKLNKKKANATMHAPEGADGLQCSNEVFGDPVPGILKGCFCSDQNVTKKNATKEVDVDNVAEEIVWGQIKLIGNNDGRTVMINTTERNITATISSHLSLGASKTAKRPAGNKRNNRQKYAFVQDNGSEKQRWKKETHKRAPGAFRLIDETGNCLWANAPKDFKRNKNSAYVVSVKGRKGVCTFWEKKQSGEGWNIVMSRPGTKSGQDKYAFMNGWGLAVLGWCKPGDCELGPDRMYLALHSKAKKHSIFTSAIFAAPANVTASLASNDTANDTLDDNSTAANDTNATDATPAAAPAAATPAAAPAAGGAAAAPAGNASNSTNATKKNKSKKAKKKALPEPYAGDNSDDEAAGQDLSYDIDEEDEFEGLEGKEKVAKALE